MPFQVQNASAKGLTLLGQKTYTLGRLKSSAVVVLKRDPLWLSTRAVPQSSEASHGRKQKPKNSGWSHQHRKYRPPPPPELRIRGTGNILGGGSSVYDMTAPQTDSG